MRNIVIFLNLRTNKKIALSNRKLAWLLYEKICLAEQQKYIQYVRFNTLLSEKPFRFMDYELTAVPLNNPSATDLDELYKNIVSFEPATVARQKIISIPVETAIPMDFKVHQPETSNEQTPPAE